jgi:hypothetical protein
MTEQNPNTPPEDGAADTAPPEPAKAEATGYAVYDETELRFRGRVFPTKGEANSAKADIGRALAKGRSKAKSKHSLTVRAV